MYIIFLSAPYIFYFTNPENKYILIKNKKGDIKMNFEEIKEEVRKAMSEKRFNHSCGVAKRAVELAKIYGIDEEIIYKMLKEYKISISDKEVYLYPLPYELYEKQSQKSIKNVNNLQIIHKFF